jgi:hypothetical protein
MLQAPPGWYPDPYDPTRERAWDGTVWTNQTRSTASTAPDTWGNQTWRPPTMATPEPAAATPAALETNWRRLGVIVAAFVLPVVGFVAGYAAHHPDEVQPQKIALAGPPASTTTTRREPAYVDVPGASTPPGVDTAGIIAQQNLDSAAAIVTTFMHDRPGAAITQHDLESYNPNFAFDIPGQPIGGPGTVGAAVISTAIDHVPHAPRRAVFALPGGSACYYVSVVEGSTKQYGVARGADAVSHCFVSETTGGVPQVRPETKWTRQWPLPKS